MRRRRSSSHASSMSHKDKGVTWCAEGFRKVNPASAKSSLAPDLLVPGHLDIAVGSVLSAETRARAPMSWRPCMNCAFELLSHAATYSGYNLASAADKSEENPPDGQYVPTSTRNGRRNRSERKNPNRRALGPLLHVHEIRVFVDLLLRVPVQP